MKKKVKFILFIICLLSVPYFQACGTDDTEIPCGFHNGSQLYQGPKGGCYYYNSNGNKIYVDRSECNC